MKFAVTMKLVRNLQEPVAAIHIVDFNARSRTALQTSYHIVWQKSLLYTLEMRFIEKRRYTVLQRHIPGSTAW